MAIVFTSYARDDNSETGQPLGRTIARLKEQVAANLDLTEAEIDEAVFFDVKGIETGQDWEQRLGEALRRSYVLVCMCSPRYLNREYCAKEFEVFRRRIQQAGANMAGRVAIVPVIWKRGSPPMVLPAAISAFQWRDDRFPRSYGRTDLITFARLQSQRDNFKKTIDALAEIIADAYTQSALPPYPETVRFDNLPNAFHCPRAGPFNATLTVLHPNGSQWRPVLGRPNVGAVFDEVVHSMQLAWEEVLPDDDLAEQLGAAAVAQQVPVVVLGHEAAVSPPWKERLDAVAALRAPFAVVVGLKPSATGAEGATTIGDLTALLPPGVAGWVTVEAFATNDLLSLKDALTRAVSRVRLALINAGPKERVHDAELSETARHEGIQVESRPLLTGPGGDKP